MRRKRTQNRWFKLSSKETRYSPGHPRLLRGQCCIVLNEETKEILRVHEKDVVEYFWSNAYPTMQMRIAHIVAEYMSDDVYKSFVKGVLERYECSLDVEGDKIMDLVRKYHTYADFCGASWQAMMNQSEYWLEDFAKESYTVFVKALLINRDDRLSVLNCSIS